MSEDDSIDNFAIETLTIEEDDEHYTVNVNYPLVKGFPGAGVLSQAIEEKVQGAVTQLHDFVDDYEKDGWENLYEKMYLNGDYGYQQSDELVSLWMTFDNYGGGAHGHYWINTYTFNSENGIQYGFEDLFQNECGLVYVLDIILDEVRSDSDLYFESAVDTILGYGYDYNFFIDGDLLTIFFPLYDIAAYASGIMTFEFSCYELEECLKPEIFAAMKDRVPKETLFQSM